MNLSLKRSRRRYDQKISLISTDSMFEFGRVLEISIVESCCFFAFSPQHFVHKAVNTVDVALIEMYFSFKESAFLQKERQGMRRYYQTSDPTSTRNVNQILAFWTFRNSPWSSGPFKSLRKQPTYLRIYSRTSTYSEETLNCCYKL